MVRVTAVPPRPIPETKSCGSEASPLSCHRSSLEAGLAECENPAFLSCIVRRDISIVENTGTFPLWYETGLHNLDFSFWKGAESADPEATHGA
jgi:hypothetical protein